MRQNPFEAFTLNRLVEIAATHVDVFLAIEPAVEPCKLGAPLSNVDGDDTLCGCFCNEGADAGSRTEIQHGPGRARGQKPQELPRQRIVPRKHNVGEWLES